MLLFCVQATFARGEEEEAVEHSVIQQYTPTKLIGKGRFYIKWFNNLYMETESTFAKVKQSRQIFFTFSKIRAV